MPRSPVRVWGSQESGRKPPDGGELARDEVWRPREKPGWEEEALRRQGFGGEGRSAHHPPPPKPVCTEKVTQGREGPSATPALRAQHLCSLRACGDSAGTGRSLSGEGPPGDGHVGQATLPWPRLAVHHPTPGRPPEGCVGACHCQECRTTGVVVPASACWTSPCPGGGGGPKEKPPLKP